MPSRCKHLEVHAAAAQKTCRKLAKTPKRQAAVKGTIETTRAMLEPRKIEPATRVIPSRAMARAIIRGWNTSTPMLGASVATSDWEGAVRTVK